MSFVTLLEAKTKLKDDLILEDEQWLNSDNNDQELVGYINEAIRECEADIHTIYEDYFLAVTSVTFTVGQEEVPIPSNIYAHKIRRFIFEKGAERYTIDRIKDWRKFENKSVTDFTAQSLRYEYFLINNSSAEGVQLLLSPKIRQGDAGKLGKLYFIRNVNNVVLDVDVIDIPEFINYIYSHVKKNVYGKEGHPNAVYWVQELERQRTNMVETLQTMVPDADNEIEPDLDLYEEMN